MNDNFVRCYIGNASLHTLQHIQKQTEYLNDWQLYDARVFDYKTSYGYLLPPARAEALIEAVIMHSSVIAETRQPEISPPSFIWNNALLMADLLTLLSLAHARHYTAQIIEKQMGGKYSLTQAIMTPITADSSEIVSFSDLSKFINTGIELAKKNRASLEDNGFIPSIYWYHQAQQTVGTAPSVLEIALYWVSLEIAAQAYMRINRIHLSHKIDIAKRFIRDKGYAGTAWNFLDSTVDDWYSIRNFLFHEGKENQSLDTGRRAVLRQQVRDFMSLVLVEMLQDQGNARRNQIADQISKYN